RPAAASRARRHQAGAQQAGESRGRESQGGEAQPGSVPADLETAGEWPFPRASGESRTSSAVLAGPTISLGSRPPSPATAASSAPSGSGGPTGLLRPVSSEATAAIRLAAMANANATPRPEWNGLVI